MAISDVGSGLQIVGGLIELGAIWWAARSVRSALAQHRLEDLEDRNDTLVDVMVRGAMSDKEGGMRRVAQFVQDRIDRLQEALEDVSRSPLWLFAAGIVVNVIGVVLAAGWIG